MGSDELACPALNQLLAAPFTEVVAIVTQPDRPKGRRQRLAPCAAKAFAAARGVPILTPERISRPAVVARIREWAPDLIVVVAYGQYIPPSILAMPPLGAINLHPSLLPKYRGASPIQWAVANGDRETGVTILYVSEQMDAGDVILQRSEPITPADTAVNVSARLAQAGADLLLEAVQALREGTPSRRPQDPTQVTTVHKLSKEDGRIDWQWPAEQIRNRIRGFQPWPGCFTTWQGARLGLWAAELWPKPVTQPPGTVEECGARGPIIATGAGRLCLTEVQPAGRKRMSGQAWLCGQPLAPGSALGADTALDPAVGRGV